MTDIFTPEKRSEIMSRIKGKNTKPELALFELVKPLWKVCRYRKHQFGIDMQNDPACEVSRPAHINLCQNE